MTTTHAKADLAIFAERVSAWIASKAAPAILPGLRRRAEVEIARLSLAVGRAVAAAIDPRRLARAIRAGDVEAALAEIPFDEVMLPRLRAVNAEIGDTYRAAGERATAQLKARLVMKDVSYAVRVREHKFDVVDERALRQLARHGAERITEYSEEAKAAMRELLVEMMRQGVPVTSQVAAIQERIGLTTRYALAVENRAAKLRALGVAEEVVQRKAASYARELHRHRATNIARYESGWAAGAGQKEAYQQALDDGIVTEQAQRVWRTAGDEVVRDEHVEMEGQRVGINEPFTLPDGTQIDFPPTDPGCRCSVDIEA